MRFKKAKVSIILSNLNHRPFLEERIESILKQTFKEWECIVIDGFSDDGSWELFQEIAKRDKRFKIYQEPRKGVYDAWNKGIQRAKGEYVYIATSDDTMSSDFLEKMVAALDKNLECDVAYCNLTIIDDLGTPIKNNWNHYPPASFLGNLINTNHLRLAPHDGILYSALGIMNQSITQLLIRINVFKRYGLFETTMGNTADFEWGMRMGLSCNICHVPYYLATWRIHKKQITDSKKLQSAEHKENQIKFIKLAYNKIKKITKDNLNNLKFMDLIYLYRWEMFLFEKNKKQKILLFLELFFNYPKKNIQFFINLNIQRLHKNYHLVYADYLKKRYNLDTLIIKL